MIELGLVRIHKLLAHTPLPWRAIHVAGTNGKGSVCAYVSAILSHYNKSDLIHHTGHKPLVHARFTSPHLVDRWDCITIDERTIPKSVFDEVEAQVKQRNESQGIGASEFEVLTATAFEIFTRSKVDIGVVEVGMGGRLDSTNVIGQIPSDEDLQGWLRDIQAYRPPPLVTAITSIGLDHQKFLGSSITDIAAEKAGILKSGVPVVASRQDDKQVEKVIEEKAKSLQAGELTFVSNLTTFRDVWVQNGQTVNSAVDDSIIQSRWPNGAISVQLVWKALAQLGRLIDAPQPLLFQTLKKFCQIPGRTRWEGRLETIDVSSVAGSDSTALLDGAHNAQSAYMLRKHLDGQDESKPTNWVVAASQGKDVQGMLRILLRPGDNVFAVEFGAVDGMPWVKPQESLDIVSNASALQSGQHQAYGRDIVGALKNASEDGRQHERRVVIAGSLYLVGDVLRLLRQFERGGQTEET
ncbi:dihydrofolate synthetase-like protein [Elsinoe australis]|uniref:Dihydrofolate synthetase-like protein n=1 Tax=Elsinoe australis TaxID=40998 RepID=A0A4U7B3H5_9PEZI|nr:dihydrofolate synthetase-like protein [Elsinoe australis]